MSVDPTPEDALHRRIPHEARRLIDAASGRAICLRTSGSLAVRLHCETHAPLLDALGRRRLRDIDFWAYAKDQNQIELLLQEEGYLADPTIRSMHEWGIKRLIYEHPDTHVKVDVFMDELVMAHTVQFKGRLELDFPTVSLADLFLSKIQIHELTENDIIDTVVLLAEHGLGTGDPEAIDVVILVDVLRNDWGFTYTALGNLKKCEDALTRFDPPPDLTDRVRTRINAIAEHIETAPKTMRWKLRARVGTRTKWYEDVDEVQR